MVTPRGIGGILVGLFILALALLLKVWQEAAEPAEGRERA
jgi:hypothetical protein